MKRAWAWGRCSARTVPTGRCSARTGRCSARTQHPGASHGRPPGSRGGLQQPLARAPVRHEEVRHVGAAQLQGGLAVRQGVGLVGRGEERGSAVTSTRGMRELRGAGSPGAWCGRVCELEHDRLYGPPDACECSPLRSWDDDSWEDEDDDEDPVVCPNHAPEPGLHWLEGWWGGDSGWARYGVAFHRSCGQLLRQRLGYSLSFDHVWPLLQQPTTEPCPHHYRGTLMISSNHLMMSDFSFGGAEHYHGTAAFVGEKLGSCFLASHMAAADDYMLLDPLQCGGNADRIVRIWRPLVRKFQRAERRSSSSSSSSSSERAGRGSGGAAGGRGVGRGGAVRGGSAAAAAAGGSGGSQLLRPSRRITRRARVSVSTERLNAFSSVTRAVRRQRLLCAIDAREAAAFSLLPAVTKQGDAPYRMRSCWLKPLSACARL